MNSVVETKMIVAMVWVIVLIDDRMNSTMSRVRELSSKYRLEVTPSLALAAVAT